MQVVLNQSGQKIDLTDYVENISISGDIQQVARQCDISIIYPNYDTTIKKIGVNLGSIVQIIENNIEIYRGYVFSKDHDSTSNNVNITAYDGLIYMTKSQTCETYKGMTPEAITRQLCSKFNIPVGSLASTGDFQTYIANNKTLYAIMMGVYTHASKINGKKYYPLMINGALNVIEKGLLKSGIIFNGDNINSVKTSESIDSMINKVIVYDNNQSIIATAQNTNWINSFGILQTTISRDEKKDNQKMAQAELKGIERKIQLSMPGNIYLKTGYAIDVNFPLFGIKNTLFIESDKHQWNDGIYTTEITLDYENKMDEGEESEEPNSEQDSSSTSTSTSKSSSSSKSSSKSKDNSKNNKVSAERLKELYDGPEI